jgi:hypothetical protein
MPPRPPILPLLLALACVRFPPPAAIQPGSGPPLYVIREENCRTDPDAAALAGTLPDRELCRSLVSALEQALHDAGYRVVDRPDAPHAANLHIFARQSAVTDADWNSIASVTVQVMVEAIGQQVERAVEDASIPDATKRSTQLSSIGAALAEGLAHSARMRRAGLVPREEPPR